MIMPKLKYWTTLEILEQGHQWNEVIYNPYENRWKSVPRKEPYPEADFDELHRDVIIQELIKNKYLIAGDTHQQFAIPMFEDGYILVSMRVWKELMTEAYYLMSPFRSDKRNAPNFYMASTCEIEEAVPCTR